MVIRGEGIVKKFSGNKVLDGIELKVKRGEILGLIGPSGSGKTTLIKVLMGMENKDLGEITVLNESIPSIKVLDRIGYMAQSDALYEELTGRENLRFFGEIYRIKDKVLSERIDYISKLVDLDEHMGKRVSKYSGGMKRRLSLAICLIQNPELLILDEPTVGIDPKIRYKIWGELKKLRDKGKTMVVTTHVMDEAEKCDRLALLSDGKIIAIGTAEELKRNYNVISIEEIYLKGE
ncbi:MAG: ABC transporter ATP-binding protein [Clostridium sp.]